MYGHLNVILKSYLRDKHGEEKWQAIVSQSGCAANYDSHARYDDNITQKLITAATKVLGFTREAFLSLLGEFYLDQLRTMGHDELLRNLGENMLEFIDNLDYVHTYMMADYPDINMPSFRCETGTQTDRIVLHYYSFREGYHPLVIGILRRAAAVYFKSDLEIELISRTMEDVANKKGKREHVVLSIAVTKIKVANVDEPPPTFVAQTKKHGEKQILQQDIEHVIQRLEEIRRVEGEDGLPLNKARTTQGKWKAIAKFTVLYGGFVPQYPAKLMVDAKSFCNVFPYHVVINPSMEVVQSGVRIQKLMPQIRNKGVRADLMFDLLHPHTVSFQFDNIARFINTPFVLRTRPAKMNKKWGSKPMVVFRGQMVRLEDDLIIYLCSPFVRCLGDLEDRSMFVADIPIHDVTRDMLWTQVMNRHGKDTQKQDFTPNSSSGSGSGSVLVVGQSGQQPPGGAGDVMALREELAKTQRALDAEKRRSQWLYYALLPPTIADQLSSGQRPQPGLYKNATVLFSDVVSFTQMVKSVKPAEICDMLTKLHKNFNRLCRIHQCFRVESIGDAYMVVCGVPDQVATHAERIANVALGMSIATQEVMSPFKHKDGSKRVKIRVGIHSGPVVGGMIGERLPRYLVFGETVNLASRMESHGDAGKVHISGATYDRLPKNNFSAEKRGRIDVRDYGMMNTYYLLGNEKVVDDEIMGRRAGARNHDAVEVTFINEGKKQDVAPPSTRGGTPVLLKHVVSTGNSTPTDPKTPLTPPENDYIPMDYMDSSRGKGKPRK